MLAPFLERPATPQGGRPPKHPLRAIVDAIRYLVRTGCAWRLLPRDFPPPGTVYWWFAKWAGDGTLQRLHDTLRGLKLLEATQDRWRAVNGPHVVALVCAGARFDEGMMIERPDQAQEVAA